MNAERRKLLTIAGSVVCTLPACGHAPVAERSFKVGYQPFGAPMSFLPGADVKTFRSMDGDAAEGAMVDLHRLIAKDAGYRVNFVPYLTGELSDAISSRRIDIRIVVSGRLDLPTEAVSDPIYQDHEVLLAHVDDNTPYTSHDDLRGLTVGSRTGTISERDVLSSGLTYKSYRAVPELLDAVGEGQVKVGVNTTHLITSQILAKNRYPKVKIVKSYRPRLLTQFSIGVRSDAPDLLRSINLSLRRLKAQGTIYTTFAQYGVEAALV